MKFLPCRFITAPSTDIMPHVCRYIDQGRNPQLYTKECLERALARNEQVKGKIDTMTVRDKMPGSLRFSTSDAARTNSRLTYLMLASMFRNSLVMQTAVLLLCPWHKHKSLVFYINDKKF